MKKKNSDELKKIELLRKEKVLIVKNAKILYEIEDILLLKKSILNLKIGYKLFRTKRRIKNIHKKYDKITEKIKILTSEL